MQTEIQLNQVEQEKFKNFKEKSVVGGTKKTITSMDWNPSGHYLATYDSLIKIWNFHQSTDLLKSQQINNIQQTNISNYRLRWMSDNVLLGMSTQSFKIWDVRETTKPIVVQKKNKSDFSECIWNPSKTVLAISNQQKSLMFYDFIKGQITPNILKFQSADIREFQWDKTQSVLIVVGGDNNAGIIQVLDGMDPKLPPLESYNTHVLPINCINISNDNKYFATGANDAIILLYDLQEFICLKSFYKLQSYIKNISFSSDSRYLSGCSHDSVIDIYNVNGAHSQRIKCQKQPIFVVWHPKKQILSYVCQQRKSMQQLWTIHLYKQY